MKKILKSIEIIVALTFVLILSGCGENYPDTPKNLSATAVSSSIIIISWDPVSNADGYYLHLVPNIGGIALTNNKYSTTDTVVEHSMLDAGSLYSYRVSSFNSNGESAYSKIVTAITLAGIPSAPTNVNAMAASESSITIRWTAVPHADGYKVYRKNENLESYSEIGSTESTLYTDTDLSVDVKYYYKVSAFNISGESSPSGSVYAQAKAILDAPSEVTATVLSTSSIKINWSLIYNAESYIIYRSLTDADDYEKISTVSSASYTDNELSPETTYYYKVSACNISGESAQSASSSATTYSANAGTSPVTAINIPFGSTGITGDFPNGMNEIWYKFTWYGAGALYAIDSNYDNSSEDYGDIVVTVCDSEYYSIAISDGTGKIRLLENIDIGKGSSDPNNIMVSNWNGTFYVLVKPKTNTMLDKRPFRLFFVLLF